MLYNLLIVDDEEIAIKGIVKGIDWSELELAHVFTACDAEEAQSIMLENTIHVVLSDIDMPNQNGIELLDWMNTYSPHSVTIFLTGHADFKYAQQAIQLDSFDYLLKPIDHGVLKKTLQQAIDKVKEQAELDQIKTTYNQFYQQWNRQRPLLIERFWQDIIHYRQSAVPAHMDAAMQNYGLPLEAESRLQVILISIEQWKEEWSARDEEIMTYGIRNAAEEQFFGDSSGHIVQDGNGVLYVLLYEADDNSNAELEVKCNSFIQQCSGILHCRLSCYIGKPVKAYQIRDAVKNLLELERCNVSQTCTVIQEKNHGLKLERNMTQQAPFPDWMILLESGKQQQLSLKIDECFDQMQHDKVDYTELSSFYFGLMNMLLQWLNKKGISIADVYPNREWEAGDAILKSLARMRTWTQGVCQQAVEYASSNGKDVSQVVYKVQRYMQDHLDDEFSRERVAEQVYLNPAYLSRMFRRETGLSLTDYMVKVRIARAREDLEKTNQRVSDIAINVGYANFSHFSKLFKKMTGLTPQEYRKKYQEV